MCSTGAGTGFRNASDELAVTFDPKALERGLRAIFNQKINVTTEIERNIFEETLRLFNLATAKGLAESIDPEVITDRFLYELRTNNAVFSAFKTHRMQNDIAAQLIDPVTGQLKSFDKWKLDIKGMTDHYVHSWLQTEYDTAVLRAHQAADWKHFIDEADVFPNVRWMPTTSIVPDPLHERYWTMKLTLPVNHPFWQEHRPGDRWNCKCSLQQTDEPVNADALEGYTPPLPMPGLDNNPANDGKLFSDTHPYITEAYPGAQQAVDNLMRKRSPSSLRRTEEDKQRILKEWNERVSIRANEKAFSQKIGLPIPTKNMTFNEANNGRTNPDFLKSKANQINCQGCVVTHELRLRGWDVEALPNFWGEFSKLLSSAPQEAWIDRTTNSAPKVAGVTGKTYKEMMKAFLDGTIEPGRYHLAFNWKKGDAHIITFERNSDGTGFFYDPQEPVYLGLGGKKTIEEFTNTSARMINLSTYLRYYRVDNVNINPDIASKVVKKKA